MKKYLSAIYLIAIFTLILPITGEAQNFKFNSNNAKFSVKTDTGEKQIFVTIEIINIKIAKKEILNCEKGKALLGYSFRGKGNGTIDTTITIPSMQVDIVSVKSIRKNVFIFQCMLGEDRLFEKLKEKNSLPDTFRKEFLIKKFWVSAKNRNI